MTVLATPEEPGRPSWLLWVLGSAFVALLTIRDVLATEGGVIARSAYWGRDFINVWGGGQLIRTDHIPVLFDVQAYIAHQRLLFGDIGPHLYSYPPVSYPIAEAFSLLPYPLALVIWTAATSALFFWAARPWWPRASGPAWLALLTPAALLNIWTGQYGLLIGALFLLGWRKLDSQPRLAGLFFGLMLIKPHLAILVPVALLARREWQAIISAAATVVALIVGTSLWFGWQVWIDYVVKGGTIQAGLINLNDSFAGLMATTAATSVLQLGGTWTVALSVQALFSGTAIAMVVAAARRSSTRDLAMLVATATFVALPYALSYDLVVVMVGALLLLTDPRSSSGERRVATYGFLSPQLGMVTTGLWMPITPLVLAALAFVQFRRCSGPAPAAAAEPATAVA